MEIKPIVNIGKALVQGVKKAKFVTPTCDNALVKIEQSISSNELSRLSMIKEKFYDLVSKSEFLQSTLGKSRYTKFLKQTNGDYELLNSLLSREELIEDTSLLQSILNAVTPQNSIVLKRYLTNGIEFVAKNQQGILSKNFITKNHLNAILNLNRNNENVVQIIDSPQEVSNLINKIANIGKTLTCDAEGQNQIMNVLVLGRLSNGTPAVLNKSLLNDFENVVHGKSYYKKFAETVSLKELGSKVKEGEAFSIGGKMYIKESDDVITSLEFDENVFEKLFPPIERYNICQGKTGDCFFLSPLNSMMEKPNFRTQIYKMFKGSKPSKISILNKQHPNDALLFDDVITNELGIRNNNAFSLLEQYQALSYYGEGIPPSQIVEYNPNYVMRLFNGVPALGDCSESYGIINYANKYKANNIGELKEMLAKYSAEKISVINFGTKPIKYNPNFDLAGGHVYSVKGYDKNTGLVTIANPWHGGIETSIDIAELDKYLNYESVVGIA